MPYPVIYNVTYSYTAFQQSQGDNSFPGTQLDADLAGLESTIDGVAAFVERSIRSDGQLQNGLVTYDSLSPALQTAGLAPAAVWATGVDYPKSANVIQGSNLYRATVAHTSGVFATDLAAGKWLFVVALPVSGNMFGSNNLSDVTVKATAFDNIAPTTTRGDIVARGAAGNIRLAKATAGYFLGSDGTDALYQGFKNAGTGAVTRTWQDKLRENTFCVFDFGAVGDGSTDDTAAIQACINAASAASSLSGYPCGTVYAPPGYIFKVSTGLVINSAIRVQFLSAIWTAATAGVVLTINSVTPAKGSSAFDMHFVSFLQTSGNVSAPTSANPAGLTAVKINAIQFSHLRIDQILGFTYRGLWLDGNATAFAPQDVLHSRFKLGQVVYNGQGVYMNSIDAATSCVEVILWDIQMIYSNFINLKMDNLASSSHTFHINSMDSCGAGGLGISCGGGWNYFYVGYSGCVIQMEATSAHNTVQVTNTLATLVSFNDLGTDNWLTSGGRADKATQIGAYIRLDQIAPPIADISLNNRNINFLLDPSSAQQAATKNYVDTSIADTIWTTYTPTVGAGTGTITTSSATGRYKQHGKTVFVELEVTITTNGTGASFVTATLPLPCKASTFFGGKERAVSGKLVGASVAASSSTLAIGNYDNTYPAVNGSIIVISGVFETT